VYGPPGGDAGAGGVKEVEVDERRQAIDDRYMCQLPRTNLPSSRYRRTGQVRPEGLPTLFLGFVHNSHSKIPVKLGPVSPNQTIVLVLGSYRKEQSQRQKPRFPAPCYHRAKARDVLNMLVALALVAVLATRCYQGKRRWPLAPWLTPSALSLDRSLR
jgi:hypothetical protein